VSRRAVPVITPASELHELTEQALDLLHECTLAEKDPVAQLGAHLDEQHEPSRRDALSTLRYCASAAAKAGEVGMLPLLARALAALPARSDRDQACEGAILDAVRDLLRAGAPLSRSVERLAAHRHAHVRAAVARGLTAREPQAVALLSKLASDLVPEVRTAARAALAERAEVPWWLGKFASDPVARLARLAPEQAARLRGTLEELSALLDQPAECTPERDGALGRLLGALPDALAVEAAERVLIVSGALPGLGAMMIARPGGPDALVRVCVAWGWKWALHTDDDHVRMIAEAPPEARVAACLALARYATSAAPEDRTSLGGPYLAAWLAGRAYEKPWG